MTLPKILLVDDDENILQGYHRNLHRHFPIEIACGGESALMALENHGPFAVLVADMRMPGMSGLELLKVVKDRWPDIIRIMLTGNADQSTAVHAVNQGEVFRFLTKPCDHDTLRSAISAGLRQFYLLQSERVLLEKTLMGSIWVLTDLLGSMGPEAHRHSQLNRERARALALALKLEETWPLEAAALLAPIGYAILPEGILLKIKENKALTPTEKVLLDCVPEFGARLLENIPRLEGVVEILRLAGSDEGAVFQAIDTHVMDTQALNTQASRAPAHHISPEEVLSARILKHVIAFTERETQRKDIRVVLEDMRLSGAFDPEILTAMHRLFSPGGATLHGEKALSVDRLIEGMILARAAKTASGQLLIRPGARLGSAHLFLLETTARLQDLELPLYIQEP